MFGKRHNKSNAKTPPEPPAGYALASKRVSQDRAPVRFMYREQPDRPDDSGWRFFAGDESDEYANEPDNISLHAVTTICEIDPDIIPHLNAPHGTAFEKAKPGGPFTRSDWQIPTEEST